MKILFACSECSPFAASGGLADVQVPCRPPCKRRAPSAGSLCRFTAASACSGAPI